MKLDKGLAIVIVALLACGTFIRNTQYTPNLESEKTLEVSGEGKITLIPDTLILSVTVTETGSTTELAQKKMNTTLSWLQNLFSNHNIPANQIKTRNLEVYPEYEYDIKTETEKFYAYLATQELQIKLTGDKFEEIGSKLIAELPSAWNVEIEDTIFSISDEKANIFEAREKAFEDAKANAEHLAKLANRKLGKVISISNEERYENYDNYTYESYSTKAFMTASSEAEEYKTYISAGEEEKTYRLYVTFELK